MEEQNKYIGIVLIRSLIRIRHDVMETFKKLKLTKKHKCVFYKDTPSVRGMAQKVKDFVTWGEINEEVAKEFQVENGKVISLHPPRGGFERKGIKVQHKAGGALGYRADKINELLMKMKI